MTDEVQSEERFVLTNENRAEFMAAKLNLTEEPEVLAEPTKVDAELEPATEEKEAPENDTKSDKPNKLEKRFSEMTAKIKAAEERAEKEASDREKLAKELESYKTPKQEPAGLQRPKAENYQDPFQYADDLEKFVRAESARDRDLEIQKAVQADRKQKIESKIEEFKKEHDDYDDVLQSANAVLGNIFHNTILDAIADSDYVADLLYEISSDTELAKKIAEMPIEKSLKFLGKLEARFESEQEEKKAPKVANVSKAPQPITPVKGGSRTDVIDEENLSFKQHVELRRAGKLR